MSENPYERLIDECAWKVVQALLRGEPLRTVMASQVFPRMLAYFKELK